MLTFAKSWPMNLEIIFHMFAVGIGLRAGSWALAFGLTNTRLPRNFSHDSISALYFSLWSKLAFLLNFPAFRLYSYPKHDSKFPNASSMLGNFLSSTLPTSAGISTYSPLASWFAPNSEVCFSFIPWALGSTYSKNGHLSSPDVSSSPLIKGGYILMIWKILSSIYGTSSRFWVLAIWLSLKYCIINITD